MGIHRTLPLLGLALAVFVAPEAGLAQTATLAGPTGEAPEAFSLVQTVRELPDGRVLVADPLGQVLVAVDFDAGGVDTLGRSGHGPGEYRQPDAVWPLPDAGTLLVDLGNGRLTEMDASLGFGETRPIAQGEPGPGRELVLALPQGVDDRGRVYFRSLPRPGRGSLPDSGAVLRLDRASGQVDTVTTFKLQGRTQQSSGGAGNQRTEISPIPLSPTDAWGVAPDGRVAVARSGDYHLEWIQPDGRVVEGSAVPYDPIRIGNAEWQEWADEQSAAGGGLRIGVTVNDGAMSMQFGRGGGEELDLDAFEWPDRKPPFYEERIGMDDRGRAWVRRHVDAGGPPTYDVFDGVGERIQTVELAPDRRLVGFGSGTAYLVRTDPFDLQYLERYSIR